MTLQNYKPELSKNDILIAVPFKYMFNQKLNELKMHLENIGFDVELNFDEQDSICCVINQCTDRRVEILGALAYYKIKGANYMFAIEQNNNTLFVSSNLFE